MHNSSCSLHLVRPLFPRSEMSAAKLMSSGLLRVPSRANGAQLYLSNKFKASSLYASSEKSRRVLEAIKRTPETFELTHSGEREFKAVDLR
jgi:hypothetical protein